MARDGVTLKKSGPSSLQGCKVTNISEKSRQNGQNFAWLKCHKYLNEYGLFEDPENLDDVIALGSIE